VIDMDWKKIVFGSIVCFLVWALPLMIITKIMVGYFFIGGLMGMLCYYVAAPRFNSIIDNWYKTLKIR